MKRFVVAGILVVAVGLLFGCFRPNMMPIAEFVWQGDLAGEPVQFNASDSVDPDGDILTYTWSFGDGATGSGVRATHYYQSAGTFEVLLTVVDGDGALATCAKQVEVAGIAGDPMLSVQNVDSPESQEFCTCQLIRADVQNVLGPCTIDWGDGRQDIGNSAEHYYRNPAITATGELTTYKIRILNCRGEEVLNRSLYVEACCFEPPLLTVSVPRVVNRGDSFRVIVVDPDQGYTWCGDNSSRPVCQECGAYQVVRAVVNELGICLIQAKFYVLDGGIRKELVHVQELDLENPVLRIPDLPFGWYELELLAVDDDPDCDNGRQTVAVLQFRVG